MKKRNSVRCTYEMLKELLKLDDGIQILNIVGDPKTESVEIFFTSDVADYTGEGHHICSVDYDSIHTDYIDNCQCPCGGRLLPSGANGIAEDEAAHKIINVVNYVYCDSCSQDYAYKTVLEEVILSEIIKENEEEITEC